MKVKVKRLTSPAELSDILLKIPDTLVQWVVENSSNPKVYILAEMDADNLIGYVVAIDSVAPPVSDYFTVLFCGLDTAAVFDELSKIAKSNGAAQIVMIASKMTDDLENLGFKQLSVNVGRSL